jgi:hypothetical protein
MKRMKGESQFDSKSKMLADKVSGLRITGSFSHLPRRTIRGAFSHRFRCLFLHPYKRPNDRNTRLSFLTKYKQQNPNILNLSNSHLFHLPFLSLHSIVFCFLSPFLYPDKNVTGAWRKQ